MRLYLIRHAESVDNVAGLYAGSRDSPLTAHGALQVHRLACGLAESCVIFRIFTSPLRRAASTAEALCDAQVHALGVVQVPELREKDFGSLEGVAFRHGGGACQDAETAQSMRARVGRFWEQHLLPMLRGDAAAEACAIVAHGIILRVLASFLLEKASPGNVLSPSGLERNGLPDDGSAVGLLS